LVKPATVRCAVGRDTLADGDYFGEMALLADTERSATVRATRPCLLLALWRQDFETLVAGSPELRGAIDQLVKVRGRRISALAIGNHGEGTPSPPATT
jgi:CRP-like cAMP-binding protein